MLFSHESLLVTSLKGEQSRLLLFHPHSSPCSFDQLKVLEHVFPVLISMLSSVCREIFPYLVVVIGLENVLVLTKSVVSTPVDLEVKLRIAQGMSRVSCHVNLSPDVSVCP